MAELEAKSLTEQYFHGTQQFSFIDYHLSRTKATIEPDDADPARESVAGNHREQLRLGDRSDFTHRFLQFSNRPFFLDHYL